MKRLICTLLVGLICLSTFAPPARAGFSLTIEDLGTGSSGTISEPFNSGGTFFTGPVGGFSMWGLILSKPILGGYDLSEMVLQVAGIQWDGTGSGPNAGTLRFFLQNSGFTEPVVLHGEFQTSFAGTMSPATSATIDVKSWIDPTNQTTVGGSSIAGLNVSGLSGTPNSAGAIVPFDKAVASDPFSMMTEILVHFSAPSGASGNQVSFTQDLAAHAPEPASLAAWSVLSLAGLAIARRRRKKIDG